jgi:hypothetical protein
LVERVLGKDEVHGFEPHQQLFCGSVVARHPALRADRGN